MLPRLTSRETRKNGFRDSRVNLEKGRAMETKEENGKSIGWVAGMLALLVTYFGWGFMAADYFQHADPNASAKTGFWANSIAQLPNFGSVISHAFQNRLWLVGIIVFAELFVLVLWVVLKKVEKDLGGK